MATADGSPPTEGDEAANKENLSEEPQDQPSQSVAGNDADAAKHDASPPRINTRLMIAKMNLENFKSYYGHRLIGPFHKRFSAVIGPNGSGKSNTIDALMFVFGKRGKKLRAKKLVELIHSSDQASPDYAKVTVFFHVIRDDESKTTEYEVVEGSEFSISRTITKKGNAYYKIDGKTTTRDNVERTLKNFEIDLNNNRFLILQGEVEAISLMKPKAATENETGFLEYLEDIIGSHRFIEPIKNCEKRCLELSESCQEKLNRVKIIEKDRDGLKGARDEAIGYMKKELQRDVLKATKARVKFYQTKVRQERSQVELEVVGKEVENQTKITRDIKEQVDQLLDQGAGKRALLAKLEIEKDLFQQRFHKAEAKYAELKETRKDLKKQLKERLKKMQQAEDSVEQSQHKIHEADEQIPERTRLVETLTKTLAKEEAQLEKLSEKVEKKIAPLRNEKSKLEKKLIPKQDVVNQREQDLKLITDKIADLQNEREKASEKFREAQQKLDSIKAHEMGAAIKEVERVGQEEEIIRNDMERLTNEVQIFGDEMKKSEVKVAKWKDIKEKIETALAAFANSASRVVKKLMEAVQNNQLQGIHGRLGDLGGISKDMDVAASTAGAGGLNMIVCETTKDAKKALGFLKKNNIGRAKLMCLDKIQNAKAYIAKPKGLPKGGQRLLDMIKCDDKYRVCFAKVFRNTLVAKNGKEAQRLAFGSGKRWRVVTADKGALIETSGTMSGGGRPYSGLIGSEANVRCDYTQGDLDKTIAKYEKHVTNIQTMKTHSRDRQKALKKAAEAHEKCTEQLKRKHDLVKSLQKRIKSFEKTMPKLEKAAKNQETKAEQDRLTSQVGQARRAKEDAERHCTTLQQQIALLEGKMMSSGGRAVKETEERLQGYRDKKQESEEVINTLTAERKAAKKALKSDARKLEKGKKDVAKLQTDMKKMKENMKTVEQEAVDISKLSADKDQEYQDKKNLNTEEDDKLDQLQAEYLERTSATANLQEKHSKLQNILRSCRHHLPEYNAEMKMLEERVRKAEFDLYGEPSPEEVEEMQRAAERGQAPREAADEKMDVDGQGDSPAGDGELDTSNMSMDVDLRKKRVRKRYVPLSMKEIEALTEAELEKFDVDIRLVEGQIVALDPNMAAIEAYKKKDRDYQDRWKDLEKQKQTEQDCRAEYDKLRKERQAVFMSGFTVITNKLKEMYRLLTFGGDAELELVDSIDPFMEGIQFSVRPPKKSWKVITNLSGGEKTLASMALIFALHHFRPTPIYCMDEIDAALDFKNVSIVANYIKQQTKNAQFIVISLRNNMFDLANRLVGIYKTFNCSKSITIDPDQFMIGDRQGGQGGNKDTAGAREKKRKESFGSPQMKSPNPKKRRRSGDGATGLSPELKKPKLEEPANVEASST